MAAHDLGTQRGARPVRRVARAAASRGVGQRCDERPPGGGVPRLSKNLLDEYDLPGEAVVIEITETTIITDFLRSQAVILDLRDLGIVVSIDDFGAGFTSLAYLSSLAVGELKLDRAFITALNAEGNGREIELVRATINLGHDMGLRVVAEGIEDVETLDLLGDLGCDLAQGYFISRPPPPVDSRSWRLTPRNSPAPSPSGAVHAPATSKDTNNPW